MSARTIAVRASTLLAAFLSAITVISATISPASANDFNIGAGPLAAVRAAATSVLSSGDTCGLKRDQLVAMMLSIPMWEIVGGSRSAAPSPMTLSRYDGWSSSKNRPLYSDGTFEDYKRAHWNPGVGLWQLDTYADTEQLATWGRVRPSIGGRAIGDLFRDAYCGGRLKTAMSGTFFACAPSDRCYSTYTEIWNNGDGLRLDVNQDFKSWTGGGVSTHDCRFGTSGDQFDCGFINTTPSRTQGFAYNTDPMGSDSQSSSFTPLALPFFSFVTPASNHRKWNIWLKGGTGYNTELSRWAPSDTNARNGGEWSHTSSLQVKICEEQESGGAPRCYWSSIGLDP